MRLPSPEGKHLVSIIVVTINTPRLTRSCLQSVIRNTTVPYELIVVMNSRARAIRRCLEEFQGEGVRILRNPRNLGYAKAANQGILASRGQFLCFLNSDTIVPPRWAQRLLDAARKRKVGAVCAEGNRADCRYPWPPHGLSASEATTALADEAFRRWHPAGEETVPWLSGFCLMIPKAVLSRVGLFDERLFFGYDDWDYSLRLRLRNYRLLRVRSLFIHHQKSGSIDQKKRNPLDRQAKGQFMEKWQTLLRGKFADRQAILREIERGLLRKRSA